ncbi:histidine kinase [Halalkalicoccus ordinarius]|uniref:histidine kinase n=1 Tax=Halalkalicoccus ordinarius TaxID=3116651 RepID=UPI00300EC9C6
MATDTTSNVGLGNVGSNQWLAGAAGGFLGSVLFGLIMQYVMPPPLLEIVIPAMYGIEGPALAAGWAIHQFHGVVLGLAYVALVQFQPFRGPARRLGGSVALGVAYGVLTTIGLAVIVMPLWLSAVGFPQAPPFPNLGFPGTLLSLVGHVVYALPVALAYAFVAGE